jgi:hypothetical protein
MHRKHSVFFSLSILRLLQITAQVVQTQDVGTRAGQVRQEKVPGVHFSHILTNLAPYTSYNISVRGGTDLGVLGPAVSQIVTTQQGFHLSLFPLACSLSIDMFWF